jgi:hypothetical protein
VLRIAELDRGEAKSSSIWQRGIVGHRRYPTVRLGAPAKLKYLHSKIGRRVDLARVRYGTMQSERRRRTMLNLPDTYEGLVRLRPRFYGKIDALGQTLCF